MLPLFHLRTTSLVTVSVVTPNSIADTLKIEKKIKEKYQRKLAITNEMNIHYLRN